MAYEMNLEEVLKHMASYLDIYKYLSNVEDATTEIVKEYLMKELGNCFYSTN